MLDKINKELNEVIQIYNKLDEEKKNLTKHIENDLNAAKNKMYMLQRKKTEIIENMKKSSKRPHKRTINTMNVIFHWNDNTSFDTRNSFSMIDFCELVHKKGLPISFEVRG